MNTLASASSKMESVANVEACRLCANFYMTGAEVEFINIFQPIEGLEEQLEFVRTQLKAWQLQISPGDGLPQCICTNCFVRFCGIDVFRRECVEAQQKLLQSFKNQQPSQVQLLQPTLTEVEKVIASLKTLPDEQPTQQLAVSVPQTAANYAVFAPELTTLQSSANMLNGATGTLITTNALMNTELVETSALDFMSTVSSQHLYFAQPMPDPAFDKEADYIVQSKAIEAEMEQIASQDLEEMLKGSIIPTKANELHANIMEEVQQEQEAAQRHNQTAQEHDMNYSGSDYELEDDEAANHVDADADADGSTNRLSGNPFACQYCFCPLVGSIDHLIFSNSDALSQHFFDVHDPNLPYTCPYCPQKYSSVKQRDYHVRLMHFTAVQTEKCEYCNKTLRGPLELHQYSCTFVGNWECASCGEKFVQTPLHRFRRHQRQHDPAKQYRCHECSRVFVRRANLEAHERLHRIQAATMKACNECKGVFSGDYELRRHKYQMHNGELPVKCDYCNKGFVSLAFLSRHLQHFHPEKLDTNSMDIANCTNCGASFNSLHKLRNHVQRPRDENGKCIDTLNNNNSSINKEYRPRAPRQGIYPCPHCSRRFHVKTQLSKHLNTHDDRLRPYACKQCIVRCRSAFELRQHVNTIHLNIKYYDCEVCSKQFSSKTDLQEHRLSHDELKVRCSEPNCDFSCHNERALNDHMRVNHRFISCEYCGDSFARSRLNAHLRNAHPTEIGIELPLPRARNSEIDMAVNSILDTERTYHGDITATLNEHAHSADKVRVELLNGHGNLPTLALQEQPLNSYKPLNVSDNGDMEQFFMGSLLDPDNEIIVT